MVEAFRQFIKTKALCNQTDKILLAVSGGVDSVVMADLFFKAGYSFSFAHCNFKLRGRESDGDEKFVSELANHYGVKIFIKSFDTNIYAKQKKCSIQEAARELRYNWFNEICEKHGFNKLGIAHHLDDQIETFFINLFRGSGIKGLKGISVQRGKIIRPLNNFSRVDIENYAKENKLQFREDSSNQSDKYLRNRIRHQLVPLISKLHPSSLDSIIKSLSILDEENEILQTLIEEKRKLIFRTEGDEIKAEIVRINSLSPVLVYSLLATYGFNRKITDAILQSLQNTLTGKIFYSPTHQLLIDRDCLVLKEIKKDIPQKEFFIHEDQSEMYQPIHLISRKIKKNSEFIINKSSDYASFDFDGLNFPLKLRKWQTGDRFLPYGMKGKKLVSDFLIDQKVSRFKKENVWVLLSNDEIIWLVGYRTSDRKKITEETNTVFEVKLVK